MPSNFHTCNYCGSIFGKEIDHIITSTAKLSGQPCKCFYWQFPIFSAATSQNTSSSQRIQWEPTLDSAASKELHHLFWVFFGWKFQASPGDKGVFKKRVQGRQLPGTGGRMTDTKLDSGSNLCSSILHMPMKKYYLALGRV